MASVQDIVPPFKLEGLVTLARQDLDDLPGDTVTDVNWKNDDTGLLWKNAELVRYANAAQDEFCFRQPITDANLAAGLAITHISIPANQQRYQFSERILSITEAKFVENATGDEHHLEKRTHAWMDRLHPEWDLESSAGTKGDPKFYVEDFDLRSFNLYPIPEVAGVVHLSVQRLPVKAMKWASRHLDELEIEARHHYDLLDYMQHLAYLKRDSETEDKKLSADALSRFNAKVGERPSARLLRVRRQERNYPRRVRPHFF